MVDVNALMSLISIAALWWFATVAPWSEHDNTALELLIRKLT